MIAYANAVDDPTVIGAGRTLLIPEVTLPEFEPARHR
jgi:hypothetical protein